ncbi:MAG: GAF domain-containing protein [Pseudomonadota bacterium]
MRKSQTGRDGADAPRSSATGPKGTLRRTTDLEEIIERLAARIACDHVLVTMLFNARQVILAHVSAEALEEAALALPIDFSICRHTIERNGPLLISDTHVVPELAENGAVRDFGVRAYAGAPVIVGSEAGAAVCLLDKAPRDWRAADLADLEDTAREVAHHLRMDAALRPEREPTPARPAAPS